MNRKILYRAKPLYCGGWNSNNYIFGSLLYIDDLYYIIPQNVSIKLIDLTDYLVNPKTIEEFTGFFGLRNGIRDFIFEGDRVRINGEVCKVELSILFGGWICVPEKGDSLTLLAPLNEIIELLPDENF